MRARVLLLPSAVLCLSLPMLLGAAGDGCAVNSRSPAPDVTGAWDITYDDRLTIEVTIGGSVYSSELPPDGGSFTIQHQGRSYPFKLDCSRPEIMCPSKAWPKQVVARQQDVNFEHRMIMTLPFQSCAGQTVKPTPPQCGAGTLNPNCDPVCNGTVVVQSADRFGVIGEDGGSFRLYLGGGIATNGFNCALLGYSVADADLVTTGKGTTSWQATAFSSGLVTVGYAGGCLWAGDPNMDGTLQALLAGASIKFTTGFTGVRHR